MRLDQRFRSARLLLVEDNPGDVVLAKRAFRQARLPSDITVAETAEKGLRILRREGEHTGVQRPDIILLDLSLPDMNGLEFLSIVKDDAALRSIPVIVLSGSSVDADVSGSYDRQATGYIVKPIAPDVYDAVVGTIEHYWFHLMQMPPDDPSALGESCGRPWGARTPARDRSSGG